MPKADSVRLLHIREAANEAIDFATEQTVEMLEQDRMRALALTRCLEIIGEAAVSVSTEYKTAHPEIPWKVMAAMRNRLIHAYFRVDLKIVLDTVQIDLPPLIVTLEALLRKASD